MATMAKDSEYGGGDTTKTQGIQPNQPEASLSVAHQLRLLYATDPADPDSRPDRYATPVYLKGK